MPFRDPNLAPSGVNLESILDCMQEGLQIVDFQWRYLFLNEAAARHGRRTSAELLGKKMNEAYPDIEHTPMFAQLEQSMHRRISCRFDNQFTYPDGETGWFELRVEPIPQGILILSVDISQRLKLESELAHSQKMEAVGRLAGGIAHDFNNLLTVIFSYASLLVEVSDSDSALAEDARQILLAAEKGAHLTRQLLALGRRQTLEPRTFDLATAVRDLQPLLKKLAGREISVIVQVEPGTSFSILADPGQLDQVLMNLVANARDAIEGRGKIILRCSLVVFDQSYADTKVEMEPGEYVLLSVSDDGCGIPAEVLPHLFEPFFTTKPAGQGTGLGLATSHGIIRQNGGHIWVYSEPGHGTTFKIYFPRARGPGPEEPRPLPQPTRLNGHETILMVDNEESLRNACCRALQGLGYQVLEAPEADTALQVLSQSSPKVEVMVVDVVMPGMDGPTLVEQALALQPDLKILFVSGYADNQLLELLRSHAHLEKPFTFETLALRLRQLLDASPRG